MQVLNQAEVRIRGPEGRWPTLPRDDLAHHFRERSFLTAPSSQMSRLLLILRAGSKHSSLRESVKLGKVALERRLRRCASGSYASLLAGDPFNDARFAVKGCFELRVSMLNVHMNSDMSPQLPSAERTFRRTTGRGGKMLSFATACRARFKSCTSLFSMIIASFFAIFYLVTPYQSKVMRPENSGELRNFQL